MSEVTGRRRIQIPPGTPIAAEYFYKRADGELFYLKRRFEWREGGERRKTFLYFAFDGYDHGRPRWTAGLPKDTPRVPYRLPELRKAIAGGRTIYLVDGEKDVETLERHGHAATTVPNGNMGNWRGEHAAYFYGAARVVVIADNDADGQGHREAWDVADSLKVLGIPVDVMKTSVGKDITEWVEGQVPRAG